MDSKSDLSKSCCKAIAADLGPVALKYHLDLFRVHDRKLGQGRLFQDSLTHCIENRTFVSDLRHLYDFDSGLFPRYSRTICSTLLQTLAKDGANRKITNLPSVNVDELLEKVFVPLSRLVFKDPAQLTDSRFHSKYYRTVIDLVDRYFVDLVLQNEGACLAEETYSIHSPLPTSPSPRSPLPTSPSPRSPLAPSPNLPLPMQINLVENIEDWSRKDQIQEEQEEEDNNVLINNESRLLWSLPRFTLPQAIKSKPQKKISKKK